MRRFGKWLGRGLLVIFLLLGGIWLLVPLEGVKGDITFQDSALGADLDAYLSRSEAQFSDIFAGAAKRIVWNGAKGARTPFAVVYLHGFSASAEEIRPVPDEVARALGANLFFTRLAGHGRDGAAVAAVRPEAWISDLAEAMAIGRRLGERVLVIGTSTGGTLAALAASDPRLSQGLAGVVMVSPNFGLRAAAGQILDLPLARYWAPLVAGRTRSFEPLNEGWAKYWTNPYPTVALFPLAALVRHARAQDFARATQPLLVIYAPADQVVDPTITRRTLADWAGPVQWEAREMLPGDDPYAHVIAGDIASPGQTEATVALILAWARGL